MFTFSALLSLLTLTLLEIVLGIDNVIFVSIIMNRLPKEKQKRARLIWMVMGMSTRCALLFGLSWLLAQKGITVLRLFGNDLDIASIVMLAGGLFLLYKTVKEIHQKLEGEADAEAGIANKPLGFSTAIFQIILIDMVFSFDSIITAGGTAKHIEIMIAAVVIAMIVMFLFSTHISSFIHKHPTLKMLALSFLVMIGLVLIVEGWDPKNAHEMHLKNYVYFAMAFSFSVEMLNMQMRKKYVRPVSLREPQIKNED